MKIVISLIGRFHAFDLAEQLEKRGYLSKLITTYPKFLVKRWNISSVNIVSSPLLELINRVKAKIPFFSNEGISLLIKRIHTWKVKRELKGANIFVAWGGSSLQAIIKAKKLGIPVVLERGSSHHSFQMKILQEENDLFGYNFKPDYYIWERDLLEYELADYISVPSAFVKKSFISYGISEDKLIVNPYGVDLSSFVQIPKKDKTFRIIFCGQISLRKGVQYLLQAFHELQLKDAELWLIGAVSPEMEYLVDRFSSEKIIYKGVQPQKELYKLYSEGSVFCMQSIDEGMAMVQLQAMACGLPLICTTNTGGEDLISQDGEEGFVIPIRDVATLKDKITYMYDNPAACEIMGRKAKLRVSTGFTWDDYGDRTVANYKNIIFSKR
jgi:glycosyltransferase involved in cell wall biosynthesis